MFKQILTLTILAMFLTSVVVPFEDAYSAKPLIIFDKPAYSPFASVKILIVDQGSNLDRDKEDVVQAVVYTKSNVGNVFEFKEVSPDAGVFETRVKLTPNQNEWPGDLVVNKDDELFVDFSSKSGSSTSGVATDFATSMVTFDKVEYTGEDAKIFVLDVEENKVSSATDTVEIMVWSTTDVKGLKLTLKEIGTDIGVFAGTLSLTKDQQTSGTTLKVTGSDVITAKYTDKTLPPPAKKDESQPATKDLFAAALVGQKKTEPGFRPPSGPELVDQFGNKLTQIYLGQMAIIQDDVVNDRDTSQKFAYIVLIKDKDGITISLSWITGELQPSTTFKASQSWLPEDTGKFTIEVFLWASIENPSPLAPQKTIPVTVTHPLE
ncbi:MAG: hypothetical protein HMLIMOIP_002458 [Candidatus Nitrosomirales archaeon]|jgi:hypothetical protein